VYLIETFGAITESPRAPIARSRAGNGIRTRDINLGKVALYQLSYSRMGISNIRNHQHLCKHHKIALSLTALLPCVHGKYTATNAESQDSQEIVFFNFGLVLAEKIID
jgi:hypothetical protein